MQNYKSSSMSKKVNKTAIIELLSTQHQNLMQLLSSKLKLDGKVTDSLNSFTKDSLGKMESLLNGGKKLKDPNAPKRGKSAFFYFCDQNRSATKTSHPNLQNHEISKQMAANWESLSEAEKKPFMDLANADKARYSSEKEKFELTKPQKKPHTPSKYQVFCEQNRESLKSKYPNATFTEMSKLLSQAWKDHKSSSDEVEQPPAQVAPVSEKPKKSKKVVEPVAPVAPVVPVVPVVPVAPVVDEKVKKPKKEKTVKA